jgi:HlyD family secretion protein
MRARSARAVLRSILTLSTAAIVGIVAWFSYVHFSAPSLQVTKVVEGPVVSAFYSTGTVEPVREYSIRASLAGTLSDLKVDKGTAVKAGDELATVIEPALQYAFDRANAELNEKLARADETNSPVLKEIDARISATEEMLQIARREQKRVTDLIERSSGSQQDLDRAMDRVKQMWSELESFKSQREIRRLELQREVEVARAQVNTARWNLDQQVLRAPIDGVVLDRPLSQGTRVAINDRVMRIAMIDPDSLIMRAAVDEEDIVRVRVDDAAGNPQVVQMSLYAFPGRTFTGRVAQIYPQADTERRTFEVDVRFDQRIDRLQPGMTGELAFVLGEKSIARVIPSQAVQNGAVYVVKHNKLEKREVQLGIRGVDRAEVIAGLDADDLVVISPAASIAPGTKVRTTFVDPKEAADLNKPVVTENPFRGF